MLKNKKPKKPKTTDYEQIGKMLQNIYESGYIDRNQLYKTSFIKGVVTGLGGVIGATIVIGLLVWLLSIFNYTPLKFLSEPLTDKLKDSVQTQK